MDPRERRVTRLIDKLARTPVSERAFNQCSRDAGDSRGNAIRRSAAGTTAGCPGHAARSAFPSVGRIEPNWTSARGNTGMSMNYFDPGDKQWKQVWMSSPRT